MTAAEAQGIMGREPVTFEGTGGTTMGIFRNRGDDDHLRFQMKERLISIGDDYWIEDDDGNRRFKVDGKALRIRDQWKLEDAQGREVATIRERKLSLRDAITIEIGGHKATVKKAMLGLRDRFVVQMDGAEDLKVHGNIVDHEYEIERDGKKIAEISKKWFRVRDSYGVEVYEPLDAALVLAVTVAVDSLSHDVG
jgi:uncharacterized protein YxjI